jgi:hypothetical protein
MFLLLNSAWAGLLPKRLPEEALNDSNGLVALAIAVRYKIWESGGAWS